MNPLKLKFLIGLKLLKHKLDPDCEHNYKVTKRKVRTLRFEDGEGYVIQRKRGITVNYIDLDCRKCGHHITTIDTIKEN